MQQESKVVDFSRMQKSPHEIIGFTPVLHIALFSDST